ncbi:MAG: NEW3 domain-containing protein [Dehalococcoidales bacterium]|nr:NEW3 domain-containing protein [Dehalococcoidales bacterium]
MTKLKLIRFFLCFLLIVVAFSVAGDHTAEAQSATGTVNLTTQFPVLRGKSGDSFKFTVSLTWNGTEARTFDLITTVPLQWTATVRRSYPDAEIGAINMPAYQPDYAESFDITFAPVPWSKPQPGQYVATFEAISGEVKKTIELTAEVTDIYGFTITTKTGNLNMEATAGGNNTLELVVVNDGTARIENITFSSSAQTGWDVIFTPDRVAALDSGATQAMEVTVRPPAENTIAGDYTITLRAENADYTPDPMVIRVTVLTPSFWGWISILIVVAVIAGLVILFRKLGRR